MRHTVSQVIAGIVIAGLLSCGRTETHDGRGGSQSTNLILGTDGELSLTQPDLGLENASADTLEIVLDAKESGISLRQVFPFLPNESLRVGDLVPDDYSLVVNVYAGSAIQLTGRSDVTIKAGLLARATIELEAVSGRGAGGVVVVIKKKKAPQSVACDLAEQPVSEICEQSQPQICTYKDVLADGTLKVFTAEQEYCGNLQARAEVLLKLCEAGRPYKPSSLTCAAR